MTITSYDQTAFGNLVTITVTSDLVGVVYFHWYVDGQYVGVTTSPTRTLYVESGEQARVEVVDTIDPAYDPFAAPPEKYSPRRTLFWIRSLAADVARYRIDQKKGAAAWATIGYVRHNPTRWSYQFMTGRLDDLTDYRWRVIPLDRAGNLGEEIALETERIVRTPDAPDFAIAFDPETTRVTFAEAG